MDKVNKITCRGRSTRVNKPVLSGRMLTTLTPISKIKFISLFLFKTFMTEQTRKWFLWGDTESTISPRLPAFWQKATFLSYQHLSFLSIDFLFLSSRTWFDSKRERGNSHLFLLRALIPSFGPTLMTSSKQNYLPIACKYTRGYGFNIWIWEAHNSTYRIGEVLRTGCRVSAYLQT